MSVVRPFLNNFSSGAITPKLYGQPDSDIYKTGVAVLENMLPQRFGQVTRRGALKLIAEITGSTGECRFIPWSVSDSIDILVVLLPLEIRLFDCSAGHTPGFIENSGVIPITSLKANRPTYSESAIPEVNYAAGNGTMYLAHRDYPLFSIRLLDYDATANAFTFECGAVQLEGSIAYTPEIEAVDSAAGDFMSANLLIGQLSKLPANTTVAVTSGVINGNPVSSVMKTVVSTPRKISASAYNILGGASYNNNNVLDGSDSFGGGSNRFVIAKSEKSPSIIYGPNIGALTKTMMLDYCQKFLDSSTPYYFAIKFALAWSKGTLNFTSAYNSESYLVKFSNGAADMTINSTSPNMTGYLKITAYGIEVNKNVIGGAAALDCVAPWMVSGTSYRCDRTKMFAGGYPLFAVKRESAATVDSDGYAITEDFASIELTLQALPTGGVQSTVSITRESVVLGQLGVIVNPFAYGEGRYPAFVAFHNGRMVVGGSHDEPNVVYMSKTNDHTNFCYFDEIEYEKNTIRPKPWLNPNIPEYDVSKAITQQIGQDSAMRLQLMTDESEALRWAVSMGDLVIGTATSEWVIPKGVTAHNAIAVLTSRNGSGPMQGRFVKSSILFASGNGRSLKMFQPAIGEVTDGISDHAEHLFSSGGKIKTFDFRQTPYFGIIASKESGELIMGTMNGNVIGWSLLKTRDGDKIESAISISSADEDSVYAVVSRKAGVNTYRYIERLITISDEEDGLCDGAYLDNRRYISTTGAAGIISGLERFYGEASRWVVFSGGGYGEPVVAIDGTSQSYVDGDRRSATFGTEVANPMNEGAAIGFRFTSRLKTLRIDSSETDGLVKEPGAIHVRVYASGDLSLKRQRVADTSPIWIPTPTNEAGVRVYPYSGPIRLENPAGNGADQSVELYTDTHEPLTIQAIAPYYSVGEEP